MTKICSTGNNSNLNSAAFYVEDAAIACMLLRLHPSFDSHLKQLFKRHGLNGFVSADASLCGAEA
jgi:hypothetical protein